MGTSDFDWWNSCLYKYLLTVCVANLEFSTDRPHNEDKFVHVSLISSVQTRSLIHNFDFSMQTGSVCTDASEVCLLERVKPDLLRLWFNPLSST